MIKRNIMKIWIYKKINNLLHNSSNNKMKILITMNLNNYDFFSLIFLNIIFLNIFLFNIFFKYFF